MNADPLVLPANELLHFCTELFVASDLSSADAHRVADSLVHANLRGVDSHGIARLPHYLTRLALGSINARPRLSFDRLGASVGRVEGDHGPGQVVQWRATQEAVSLARETGAGWVTLRNSTHCGALDYYGLEIARQGMIGLVFTHVDPMVLPQGGRVPFSGTNPICITAPGEGGQIFCLDMATSIVAWNEVGNAAIEGRSIPSGWAVDAEGRDTTDPNSVAALYPFGGHKGAGLGLGIDILCSMLSGAPYGPDVPKMYGDLTARRYLGGMVGAIDIARFVPLDTVRSRITEMLCRWNRTLPMEPGGRVLYPGEPEEIMARTRAAEGIPIPRAVVAQLDGLCVERGWKTLSELL